jgi:sugar phosphate isomerase/epimerase
MKLGFLTKLTEDECKLAAKLGYDCIEAHGPWAPEDLEKSKFRKSEAEKVREMLDKAGISISAISLYRAGAYKVEERIALYSAYIKMCKELGVGVITAMSASDPAKKLDENLDAFAAVFKEVAPQAEDAGVKIAFENWPGLNSHFPPIGSVNFGYAPQVWDRMFERVPSSAIGLEFDPSHLVWQWVDWAAALRRFASRVYHVHAKDTEIFHDRLAANGFFSGGWWRYRLPGYGVVDWFNLTSILKENGYDGGICVEHEDPVFSGARREEGLAKAQQYLRPLV